MGLLDGLLKLFGSKPKKTNEAPSRAQERSKDQGPRGEDWDKTSTKEEALKTEPKACKEEKVEKEEKKEVKKKDRGGLRRKRRAQEEVKQEEDKKPRKEKRKVTPPSKEEDQAKDLEVKAQPAPKEEKLAKKADGPEDQQKPEEKSQEEPGLEDLKRKDLAYKETSQDHPLLKGQDGPKEEARLKEEDQEPGPDLKKEEADQARKREDPRPQTMVHQAPEKDQPRSLEEADQEAPLDLSPDFLENLRIGDQVQLPAYGDIEDPRVEREDQTFYHFSFTYKGRAYNRNRIHKDILQKHLEDYKKTKSLPLKSFKESNL